VLALRADGGPGLGVGHLARVLALAQAWAARHGVAHLVTAGAPRHWADQFAAAGCAVHAVGDAPAADWWAVDGYHLGRSDGAPSGVHLLRVDDHDGAGTGGAGAEVVVDQNLGASAARYPLARAVLAGPRYALLRVDVAGPSPAREVAVRPRRLVVVLGGAPAPEVVALGRAVATDPRLHSLDVRLLDGTADVGTELGAADLAVAAAGTVSWELCRLGVPAVLVAVAPNQEPVAAQLDALGAAVRSAADPDAIVEAVRTLGGDPDRRRELAEVGRALVDGQGARRVVARLRADLLVLRDADQDDAPRLFEWANDAQTRAASFHPQPIAWEGHQAWLAERLSRDGAATYVAADADGPVGVVRYDEVAPSTVEIGVTVAPDRRGEGWGGGLVDAGCRRWAAERGAVEVVARIRPDNEGSVRAFVDADFDPTPSDARDVLRYARHLDGAPRPP
jgi:spore coat polysaccharide biosynthesis predicted glycosyltransferase SpsG/RimJ/RimL family protein N-acetyltransferase